MSNGFPSMTALLGLLAVAGYQNRDKIGQLLGGGQQSAPEQSGMAAPAGQQGWPQGGQQMGQQAGQQGGLSGVLQQLGGALGGASAGGFLSNGLNELVQRFQQNGHGETAQSWIGTGPNRAVSPDQLQQAIGPDVLDTLSRQTGLPHNELLARLSRELPNAVDNYTPQGRVPTEADFQRA